MNLNTDTKREILLSNNESKLFGQDEFFELNKRKSNVSVDSTINNKGNINSVNNGNRNSVNNNNKKK